MKKEYFFFKEVEGDLIKLALAGEFDVIVHGCNCFCTMGAGIAVAMKKEFHCDKYKMEKIDYSGDINKLGNIDYGGVWITSKDNNDLSRAFDGKKFLTVINAYTQYHYGKNRDNDSDFLKDKPFDYEAFRLCLRKINHIFKDKHIGMPKIGAGLAGGKWSIIYKLIHGEMTQCNVTIVSYNK